MFLKAYHRNKCFFLITMAARAPILMVAVVPVEGDNHKDRWWWVAYNKRPEHRVIVLVEISRVNARQCI